MVPRTHGKRPVRYERSKALIVTEGQVTEPEYLDGFRQEYRNAPNFDVVPFKIEGVGKDPLAVVQKCLDLMSKGNYIWAACLVDVDQHANLKSAISLAQTNNIQLIISNLKFETWLLWHVSSERKSLSSKELDAAVAKHHLVTGKKGKNISPRFPYQKHIQASQTAYQADKHLDFNRKGPNPSTAMPKLLELLLAK